MPLALRVRRRWSAPRAVGGDEIGDARRDLGAEARAVEDAVMADLRLHVVGAHVGRDVDADVVRRLGLADAGNVVVLAFDGQQRDVRIAAGSTGSPRWIISPFGSAWRMNTVSTVCR